MMFNQMTFYAISLCLLLTLFPSCYGQGKTTGTNSDKTSSLGRVVSELDKSIWTLFQDSRNRYWFGSNDKGVYCYDGKQLLQFTLQEGVAGNQIRGIQEDKAGNIYFDTRDGVFRFDGSRFISLPSVKSPVNQWKLRPDDLWFKRNDDLAGVYRYDGDTLYQLDFSTLSPKEYGSDYAVYSIYRDRQGNIWFGTLTGGVARFDGTNLSWIQEKELGALKDGRAPAVRSITEDKDGYFWFSNLLYQYRIRDNRPNGMKYERVNRIDLAKQAEKMKLPYYTSAVVNKETTWMTNYHEGVWKYDGKNLNHYPLLDNGTKALPMFLYKDHSGTLWLGTDNAGVYQFNGKTFEKFKL
jgi:ligand-binding sensor domain-containing protein